MTCASQGLNTQAECSRVIPLCWQSFAVVLHAEGFWYVVSGLG